MIACLLGLGILGTTPDATPGASMSMARRANDHDERPRRRSQDDGRPVGRPLEMGPAATVLAVLALGTAIVARRRRAAER